MWDEVGSLHMARVHPGKMWCGEKQPPSPSGVVRRDSALLRSPEIKSMGQGQSHSCPRHAWGAVGLNGLHHWAGSSKAPGIQYFPAAAKLLKMANYYFSSFLYLGLFMHLK